VDLTRPCHADERHSSRHASESEHDDGEEGEEEEVVDDDDDYEAGELDEAASTVNDYK
jgi:hypothetical protein